MHFPDANTDYKQTINNQSHDSKRLIERVKNSESFNVVWATFDNDVDVYTAKPSALALLQTTLFHC